MTNPQIPLQQSAAPLPEISPAQNKTPAAVPAPTIPTPQQKIAKKAQESTKAVMQAASSLPHVIAGSIRQSDTNTKIRDKHIIDTVAQAHVSRVVASQKVSQLKPIAETIQQQMRMLQSEPSGPQKTMKLSYLAHSMKSVVAALHQQSQTIKSSSQLIGAIASEPKNRRLLAKATGIDPKAQNSPEHQAMQQSLQSHLNQIHQAQQKADAAVPKLPAVAGMNGQEPATAPTQVPRVQGPHGFGHRLKQIAEVLGTIAMPEQMALIPGTPQNKSVLQQKAMALRNQILKMQGEQSVIDKNETAAQENVDKGSLDRVEATGVVPAGEKEREFGETLGERERADKAKEQQAAATQNATEAYRRSTLALQAARFAASQNPNSTQNQLKLAQVRAEQERAATALQNNISENGGLEGIARMVINHQIAPSEAGGFGMSKIKVLGEVAKIDPDFNVAQADRAYKYATDPSTQNVLNYLESLTGQNNDSGNLGKVIDMSNALSRYNFPSINRPDLWVKLERGNSQVAAYYAAVTESADQIAKIMSGGTGSASTDMKMKQALDLFNHGFNAKQIQSVASTLRTLLGNRKSALIRDNPFLEQQFGSHSTTQKSTSGGDPAVDRFLRDF